MTFVDALQAGRGYRLSAVLVAFVAMMNRAMASAEALAAALAEALAGAFAETLAETLRDCTASDV